jgi:hypothetical protein
MIRPAQSAQAAAAPDVLAALAGHSASELASVPAKHPGIPVDDPVPGVLRIRRIVSDPDGRSRLDVIELPIAASEPGKSIASRLPATDVELGYSAPGTFIDWHRVTTPRLWILLSGAWDFGTADGQVHHLKAGDIVLAADTSGQGHTSRNVGPVASFVLTVRLPAADGLRPAAATSPLR